MKTILRRKDNTSIFCPTIQQKYPPSPKTKGIELMIACFFIVIGLCIIIIMQ
ncbi:MAG TPA: hypothetical protein VN377_02435 [Candidatus Thermoplasmatota archaeon]|nr:hypothetical protein [Candidatus Thermoplasmatota archaeon]